MLNICQFKQRKQTKIAPGKQFTQPTSSKTKQDTSKLKVIFYYCCMLCLGSLGYKQCLQS